MSQFKICAGLWILAFAAGCATHVSVMSTHREDVGSQARVLAIAARNLEESIPRQRSGADEEEAGRSVIAFHAETEEFARASARWLSEDNVDDRYETMIRAWVRMKHTFPNLKPDRLTQDSFDRVRHEWEALARKAGYAGGKYERELDKNYRSAASEDRRSN